MEKSKKKLRAEYKLVHIKWHDAAMHGTSQVNLDDIKDYGIMYGHITGLLINETKDYVNIAMDLFPAQVANEKDIFRTVQSYPKSGIEKIDVLKTLEIYED